MGVGLVAVVGAFPTAIQINKNAERGSLASAYARAKLELIMHDGYDNITFTSGQSTTTIETKAKISNNPNDPAYTLERQTVATLVDPENNLNTTVNGQDKGVKKITVTVYWTDQQKNAQTLTLTSLIAKK